MKRRSRTALWLSTLGSLRKVGTKGRFVECTDDVMARRASPSDVAPLLPTGVICAGWQFLVVHMPVAFVVTGFSSFPGCPANPTELLVRTLESKLKQRKLSHCLCCHDPDLCCSCYNVKDDIVHGDSSAAFWASRTRCWRYTAVFTAGGLNVLVCNVLKVSGKEVDIWCENKAKTLPKDQPLIWVGFATPTLLSTLLKSAHE